MTFRQAQGDRESFGSVAARLAGLAGRALGWRPAEFWAVTPAELATILLPPDTPAAFGRADLDRLMEQQR